MIFRPPSNTVSAITIGYGLLVIALIFSIRYTNKNKTSNNANRRQSPRLRLLLDIMLLTGSGGIMMLISWDIWSFLKFEGIPLYPRLALVFSAFYLWLLGMVVVFIRSFNQNKQPRAAGEERRQRRWLRNILNSLIVAPFIGIAGVLIYNLH